MQKDTKHGYLSTPSRHLKLASLKKIFLTAFEIYQFFGLEPNEIKCKPYGSIEQSMLYLTVSK